MRMGLRVQVVLTLLAVVGLGFALLTPVVFASVGGARREVGLREARRTAEVLAQHLEAACPAGEGPCLEAALEEVGVGRLVSSAEPEGVPVARGDVAVWVAPLASPRADATRRFLFGFLALDLLGMLVAGALLLFRGMVRPIESLADRADSVARLELGPMPEGTQLGRLGASFRHMVFALAEERRRVEAHISELETANHALRQAQEGLVRSEKLATVGRLAAGVAHEIGNPLGGLIGYLEILRKRTPPEDQRAPMIAGALEAARRIDGTIRDLLDFSRPVAGRIEAFDLRLAVDEALRLVGGQRRFAAVAVEVALPEGLPAVRADRGRLVQVVLNLLLNAADALEGQGRVRVWASSSDREVSLGVADDGPGLPEETEALFEPFFSTKPPGQGTGLGLATSRSLVEAWGGRLVARSSSEGGAEFVVTLPVSV